jgi:hypothetical protein
VPQLTPTLTHAQHSLSKAVSAVAFACCPIPRPVYAYWNTTIVEFAGSLAPALAIAVCLALAAFFWRRWGALTIWVLAPVGMVGFIYWTFPEAVARHWGHIFLALVAALWLAASVDRATHTPPGAKSVKPPPRWRSWVVLSILSIQLVAGLWASSLDLVRPFSQAKAATDYIRDHGLANLPMVGHSPDVATSISGYLNKAIYLPDSREFAYCNTLDWTKRHPVNDEVIAVEAIRLAVECKSDVLVILSGWAPWPEDFRIPVRLDNGSTETFHIEHLASFEPTVAPDETYHLFRVILPK